MRGGNISVREPSAGAGHPVAAGKGWAGAGGAGPPWSAGLKRGGWAGVVRPGMVLRRSEPLLPPQRIWRMAG